MNTKFRIHKFQRETGKQSRRFHKIMYTAALRLGAIPNIINDCIEIEFNGFVTVGILAHDGNEALIGTIYINDQSFDDVILIQRQNATGRPALVTFWPNSQQEDAKNSYTDPLVDTAMDGTPYNIEVVASVMHKKFQENAGVSPATLMKILFEKESEELREGAIRVGDLLEESMQREKEALSLFVSANAKANAESSRADFEKEEKEKALADSRLKDAEIARLQRQTTLSPSRGERVTTSNIATIEEVTVELRGSKNQRAIVLHMSDKTQRANNWDRDFETRLEFAQALKGQKVQTDVWNLPGTDTYKWEKWFKNIYVV
jgi:hypothetical protein